MKVLSRAPKLIGDFVEGLPTYALIRSFLERGIYKTSFPNLHHRFYLISAA
jgi:hypothetical protein